MVISLLQHIA